MQAAVLLVFAALCSSQVRGIPRDEFFRTGSQALSKGNTVSSDAVDLGENFVFFGQNQATIYVSTDGLLSFGAAVTRGTPQRFPHPRALISPFWANADTSSFGDVYYMQTRDGPMLQRASSEVQSAFSDFPDFEPTVLFVATWNEVGMANSRFRLTNTFQAVLATDGTNSFVIFLYADDMMQWTNEDVPDESVPGAQVGLNPGGGRNGFSLPTSLTQYTLNITTSSNIGKQGVWIFRVDSPQIELPGVIIGLEEVSYSVQEGVGSVSICASLIGEEMDATVTVETQDVLSLADRDYTDTTLQLDFSDDVTRRCFSIDIMDDDILETEETFAVVLTTETTDIALLPQMALVIIEDNDRVTVGHLQSQWLVTESEERAFVCVQAQGQTERPIDVTVFTQGGNATVGEDYTPVTREVTIPAGSSPATCGRFIPIIDNQILEQSEFINVVVETNDEDVTIENPTAIVIIQDNDGAGVFAGFQETEFIVGENSSSVEVCVHLTGEIGHTIGINIETVSFLRTATVGSDYLDIHEVLFFSPENSTLTQCVTITILEDQILEEDESFFVMLRSSEVALTPRQARIIIQDNDDVFVRLEQYEYFVNEFTGQLRVCAILSGTLGSFAPISIIPRPGTAKPNVDYNSRVHNLNFQPPVEAGQPVRPVCANIFITNDFLYENHTEHFFVELQSSVGSVHVENRRATVYIVDNDFVFVTFTSSALALEVAEGTRSSFICIFYPSGILEVDVGVSLDTVDGTAIAGSDYQAFSEEVAFRPLINGNTVNTVCRRLHSIDDSVFEGNESFSLVLSTRAERVLIGRRRTEANTAILPVTILDDDVVTVQHKELAYDVREDAGSARVCAVVTGLSESDVGVSFTTRDRGNGAVAGVDYDSVAVETFVRAGSDEACVSIPIRDNQVQSSVRRKSFDVVLEGTHPLIRVGGEITATVTITEDDEVTVGVAQPEYSAEEGAESVTVCVTKTGEANFGITGRLVSVESALDLAEASLDYALTDVNTSFTFVASRASGSYCMEIPILDDSLVEGTETFQVQVSVDGDQPVVIDRASTTITIEDNDVAVVGFQEAEYSIGEEDGSLRFCVDLEGSIERDIAVNLTTPPMSAKPGMDYVDLSMQLVFHPSESSVCADVSILSDEIVEDMESFGLLLTTTHSQVTFSTGQAVAMVIDDDSIGVRLEQSVYSIAEDVNFIQLCLNIEGDFGVDVPITVSTEAVTAEGDEDYLDISHTLLFSPTVQQSGCVDVEIRDDDILEDSETFDVLLSSPNPAVRYTTNQSARVFITDNDRVALGLRQSEYTVGEGTGVVEVCADLVGKLGRVVPIVLESSDTGGVAVARSNADYEALSAVFEFQPSRSATRHSHCFNISVHDDDILEDTESFTVSLSTSIDGVDVTIATAQVDIVDNDNDRVALSLRQSEYTVGEGTGVVEVCADLLGKLGRVVPIVLESSDTGGVAVARSNTDYEALSAVFEFQPSRSATRHSHCFNVSIRDDDILEDTESFTVSLSTSIDGVDVTIATARVDIVDNDNDRVALGLRQSEYTVGEGTGVVEVCADLVGKLGRVVPILLESSDTGGVAIARSNADYEALSAVFEFQPSRSATRHSHCFNISVHDDDILEDTESFTVSLNTSIDGVDVTIATAQVDIVDNDNDRVALGLRQSEYTVGEGTGVVEVCADLLGKLGRVVPIVLESSDTGGVAVARSNTDYEALSAVFEFQPSRSATRHSHCFNVSIRDDDILEDAESFTVSLSTSIDGMDVGIATAQVDIVDNDEVSVSLETPAMEVSEGLGSAAVCARLTGISERVVSLALTDLPGTAQEERDYSRPAALGFRFEPSENVSCVNIGLVDDTILEHDEGFSLLMTSSDPAVTLGQTTTTLVTIRDDDTVQAVFELEEFTADENDLTVPVCVALQGSFDRSATVTLSTVDGDTARAVQDYSPLTVDLTFAPTDESPRLCVTVSLTNDISEEETEKFWVELSTTDDSVVIPTPMVAVVITDTDIVCHDDSTFNLRGDYVWEQIPPFMETLIPCSLGPLQEGGIARRTCGMGGVWDEPRLRECRGNLADIFAHLAQLKFSKENLAELALAIMQATQDNQTFPEYLSITARFLQEYSQLVQDAEILVDTVSFTDVLKIVDIIQEWPVDVLQLNSSQIVFSTEGISVGLVNDVGPFTHIGNTQNLAFKSHTADTGTIRASGVSISFSPGVFNLTTTNLVVTLTDDPSAVSINLKEDVTAVLHLPPSVFSKVGGSRAGLFFSVYDTAVSFPLDKTEDIDPLHDAMGTSVVAATVLGEEVARLNERITFALRLQRPNFTKPRCVSWVFGEDVWTEDGCKLESHVDGVVTCSCDHLTNFAVLVDISGRTGETRLSEDAEVAIEIISLVGVVLSLIGLIMTVITLVAFKKLRQKDSTKFRVQLCIAMALMMVVFIVGIDRTMNKYVCISVSVVLHYLTLVSVLWMAAGAVLMFRKLVFVFSQVTKKFIVIVSLVCWLLPLPAVIVPVVLDEDYVISEDYCFISHNIVFFVAFLGPIFAVLLFNFVMFAVVVIIICNSSRRKNKGKERAGKRKSTVRTLASLTGVMVLFGLTWVFAAFTVRSASVVFQFLFAIFNSLQGFFIFLFFVVLAKEARELWLVACGCKKQKFVSQATATTPTGSRTPSRAASLKMKFPEFDDADMEAQVRDRPFNYWDVQYIVPPRLRWNISFSHSDTTPSHSRQVSNASPDLQTPMEQIPRQLGRVDESAEAVTQRRKQYPHIEIKPVLKIRTSTPIDDREDSFMQQDTGIGFTPLTLSTATAGATTDISTSGTARKTELAEGGSSAESSPETRRKEKLFHGLLLDKLEADNADSGLESQSSSNEHLQGATQSVTPPSEEPARCASAGATYDFTAETDI